MLINATVLENAVVDLNVRNELIKDLDLTPDNHPLKNERLVLALWLGANSITQRISKFSRYIHNGYYFFLVLDKQISSLCREHPGGVKILIQAQQKLLACYNEHYELLTTNPQKLFHFFEHLIQKLNTSLCNPAERLIINQTQQLGLKVLSPRGGAHRCNVINPSSPYQPSLNNLNQFANRMITADAKLHPYAAGPLASAQYLCTKYFLRTADGMLLDGFYVKRKKTSSRYLVLILMGHFQAENKHVWESIVATHKLFDTDVFFINHRNYALRSAKKAISIDELAQDVITFATHFYGKRKKIVLYGMCGGAAHMILAAQKLTAHQRSFKLILDRFSRKYLDWSDYKSYQLRKEADRIPTVSNTIRHLLTFLILLLVWPILKLDINFGKIIQQLPEEDVLVLEARGKKHERTRKTYLFDYFVHPKNNLRAALKEKRLYKKALLQNLKEQSMDIAINERTPAELHILFHELSRHFDLCLQLISNEKLTLNSHQNQTRFIDLHPEPLHALNTRHDLPTGQFLQGFFKAPSTKLKSLDDLATYSKQELEKVLPPLSAPSVPICTQILSEKMMQLIADLIKHKDYITHMANRLLATGLGNMSKTLDELVNSSLFQQVAANRPQPPAILHLK